MSECKALFVRVRHESMMSAQLGLVFSESAPLGHVRRNGAQERALPALSGERDVNVDYRDLLFTHFTMPRLMRLTRR